MDALIFLGPLIGILNGLGLLKSAKNEFLPEYQEIADNLSKALKEMEKNCISINDELDKFVNLKFDKAVSIQDSLKMLDQFNPTSIETRMKLAKGNCGKISNIYHNQLKSKLREFFYKTDKITKIEEIFTEMSGVDGVMDSIIDGLKSLFTPQIDQLKVLIKNEQIYEANDLVIQVTQKLILEKEELLKKIDELKSLESDFNSAAKTS